jgi:tetratricopeptide (TPR) repeat protein
MKTGHGRIFISRAGADALVAAEIARLLEAAGHQVTLQQWDFSNSNFISKIHEALTGDARIVALLSPEYLGSEYCQAEWSSALADDPLNRNGRLILLRVAECKPDGLLGALAYWDLCPILGERAILEEVVRDAVSTDRREAASGAGPYWHPAQTIIAPEAFRETLSFEGREAELGEIASALESKGIAVIRGIAGVGKSVLAREYGRRSQSRYAVVWWLDAETEDGIIGGLTELGSIFVRGLKSLSDKRASAQQALRMLGGFSRPVLLVFDNLEDERLISRWRVPGARVLITARSRAWGEDFAILSLSDWPLSDAVRYLRRESGRSMLSDDDAGAIVDALGRLPLALSHAAAYLKLDRTLSAADYLKEIGEHLDRAPRNVEYSSPVFATFQATIARVEGDSPGAAALLCLASLFAPDDIPLDMFSTSAGLNSEGLAPLVGNVRGAGLHSVAAASRTLKRAVGALDTLSLVDYVETSQSLSMHRLVQAAARDLVASESHRWIGSAIAVLERAFPEVDFKMWSRCDRLLPHSLAVCGQIVEGALDSLDGARLLDRTGCYLRERARYAEAEPLVAYALQIRERMLHASHLDVAQSLSNLAFLYVCEGRYAEAEPRHKRALEIRQRELGPEHPLVAQSLSNIATMYWCQGHYAEAEPLYVRALAIHEKALDPDHAHVAQSIRCLADLYWRRGLYAKAEPLYRRALAILERTEGSEHPDVAGCLNNLALMRRFQGDLLEAEPLYRRALAIWERSLGQHHPSVASALAGLAAISFHKGRLVEAEQLSARAVRILERSLGPEHPLVAHSLIRLADISARRGHQVEAEQLYKRVLEIWERSLGPEHDDVAWALTGLGNLYVQLLRYAEAEQLYKRAVEIWERSLGPTHDDLAWGLMGLGNLYVQLLRHAEAEPFHIRALSIRERALGSKHPDTVESRARLVELYDVLGRRAEARDLERRGATADVTTRRG